MSPHSGDVISSESDCAAPIPLLKGAADVAISSVLLQCISGVSFFFLVRSLDSESYGKYAIVVSATASLFAFAGNWITPYLVAEGTRQYNVRASLGDVYWGCAALSFLCSILFLPVAFSQLPDDGPYRFAALPLIIGAAGLPLLRCGYQIIGDFRGYGRLMWLDRAAFLAGLLFLRLAGPLGALQAVSLAAVAQIAALMFGARALYRRIDWKSRDLVPSRFFAESFPTLIAAFATYFSSGAFAVLIFAKHSGASAAGAISAAYVLAGFAAQPALWLSPVILPRFAVGDEAAADIPTYISRLVIPAAALYGGLIAFSGLLLPYAVGAMGAQFKPYLAVFSAVLATAPPDAVHMLLVPVLFGRGRSKVVMVAAMIKALVFLTAVRMGAGVDAIALCLPAAAWLGALFELWALKNSISLDAWALLAASVGLGMLPLAGPGGCVVAALLAAGMLRRLNKQHSYSGMLRANVNLKLKKIVRDIRDKTFLGDLVLFPFKLLRTLRIPIPETIFRHLPYRGVVDLELNRDARMRILSSGNVLENGLYWRGIDGYEPECLKIWCELASSARIVIDVGANTGLYSLLAAASSKKAFVHGFEPLKRIELQFKANCGLNPSFNITTHSCAVSDADGEAIIHDPGDMCPSSASLDAHFLPSRETRYGAPGAMTRVTVPVRSLDSFPEFSGGDVDLIKIDAEGVETRVLSGAKKVISRSRPAILLEFLEGQAELARTIAELQHDGYRLYQLFLSGPRFVRDAAPSPESWNVLLIPQERDIYGEAPPFVGR